MAIKWTKVEQGGTHDFEKEKTLVGKLISVKHNVGQNESTVYNIKKEDGEVVGVWGSVVLDDRMATVEIGQHVKIEYHGRTKGKSGRQVKNFDVHYGEVEEEQVGGEKE